MSTRPGDSASPTTAHPDIPLRRRLEWILTAVALLALLASLGSEAADAPSALILTLNVISYLAGGWFGAADALETLRARKLDINVLMIAAALGAAVIDQWHEGATLLFLFALSNTLQSYALERSRRAISKLLKLRPKEARRVRDGVETLVPIEALDIGDRVVVRPGELLPTDGQVRDGHSTLNESSITGESAPVEKSPGDSVFAGTLNGAGALEVEVTRRAADSTLARIIALVETAQAEKARSQRFLERYEGAYALLVFAAAALAVVLPWFAGAPFAPSFYRAMVLLVVASPCALVISTPAAILAAIANGARRGVLFKGGVHLERLARIRVVAFDKTGTLTEGRMQLTDVVPTALRGDPATAEAELLRLAAALEQRSEHPIAEAIVTAARARGLTLPPPHGFVALPGRGVHAVIDDKLLWLGGSRLFAEHGEEIDAAARAAQSRLEAEGKSVLILHRELARQNNVGAHEPAGGWLGALAVADTVRPTAADAVRRLRAVGIRHIVILSGDNARVAEAVGRATGVDEVRADLLPEEKVHWLRHLRDARGSVLMVGDGVNDAPALAVADVGVAMGAAGSDVALETADVVLMSDRLENVAFAIGLSRAAHRVVWQNLTFALAVVVLLVLGVFWIDLPLPLGVVGHEGSTLLVVANGLRLLGYRDGAAAAGTTPADRTRISERAIETQSV